MSYYNFAKLENGIPKRAEKYMRFGDVGVLYPSDELLIEHGYKRISYEGPADPAPEGYHWEAAGWEETEDEIKQTWNAVADPVPSDADEIDSYEAAEILLGGEPL